MPIQNRDYYGAAERGRQDKQQFEANALSMRGAQQRYDQNALMQTQQLEDRAGEQKKAFATQMVQAAQYALQSQSPKEFLRKNYPKLAQMNPTFETDDDNAIRAQLQEAIGVFGPQAGVGPAAPAKPENFTLGQGQKRFGPNGEVIAEVAPRPGRNIRVRSADGSEIVMGEDGTPQYGANELGQVARNKLEEAFTNAQGNAYALREQIAKYRDEFSTLSGRAKAAIASGKELIGMENAPQQTQFLADFTAWKADTNSLLSQYLNQLSGAAISPHEEVRLKAGFPNADDGPTQYKAKAEATMKRFALAQARAAYLLSAPGVKMDSISLDGMSNIIATEANKLAKALERGGMEAEAARQKAIMDTRQRFGMGQ